MNVVRKINKTAKRSYSVVIPIEFVRKLKWQERQKVILSLKGKKITIKDCEK
ncbi:MAG: AbrB/MazE/SpoVT family DNA-binding domain-containing protein [Candidatus Omnitrophica bacterium]|nr:AbrB/MazE/SpoVT family DNA-binding domain-containing protein [Candidatus Omnitrophota bacterium]